MGTDYYACVMSGPSINFHNNILQNLLPSLCAVPVMGRGREAHSRNQDNSCSQKHRISDILGCRIAMSDFHLIFGTFAEASFRVKIGVWRGGAGHRRFQVREEKAIGNELTEE